MKPSPRLSRTPSRLSDSLHHRLNLYAVAAGAAGMGLLFLGQSAEAKVVYTPTHKWLPLNQYFSLDLNHDGINDFKFHLISFANHSSSSCSLLVRAASQSSNEIYSTVWERVDLMAAALPKGTKVGPANGFQNQLHEALMFAAGSSVSGNWSFGPWLDVTNPAYLGLRFLIKGEVHYGWALLGHIRVQTGPGGWCNKPARALLTGYAYETIPSKPIITGRTKGPHVVTVEPGSLGALAAGRE